MSSSFNLTPFEPVYPKVEHLSFALGEFAKTPSDPKVSVTSKNCLISPLFSLVPSVALVF